MIFIVVCADVESSSIEEEPLAEKDSCPDITKNKKAATIGIEKITRFLLTKSDFK